MSERTWRCAYCGNTDNKTLFDEDDTFYCSKCTHRTRKDNGKDDVVKCPYCHRMRDRKAYYCRYCNDTNRKPSTRKEFKEIDELLKSLGF